MEERHNGIINLDMFRYGIRLKNYLLALPEITKNLSEREKEGVPIDKEIDEVLKKTLPHLMEAFNSKLAFIADWSGKVIYTNPKKKNILERVLFDIPPLKSAIEKRGYDVVDNDNLKDYSQLYKWHLDSLLVVRFDTPVGQRYVGVANGKYTPPYLNEDKVFLEELMKIFLSGLMFSYEIAETELRTKCDSFLERYQWARIRGEFEYLSQASKDYARNLLTLKPKHLAKKNGKSKVHKDKLCGITLDEALADFLGGKLCCFIQ